MTKLLVSAVMICGALVSGCGGGVEEHPDNCVGAGCIQASESSPDAEASFASSGQAVLSPQLEASLSCIETYVAAQACDWTHWSEMYDVCQTYEHLELDDGRFLVEVKEGRCTPTNWPTLRAQVLAPRLRVLLECQGPSQVLHQAEFDGCYTPESGDASYVDLPPGKAATLYSGVGCTGDSIVVQADANLCQTSFASGAGANNNVRSFRLQDVTEVPPAVLVREHCDGSSRVIQATRGDGCHELIVTGASFVDVPAGKMVRVFEGAGCSGRSTTLESNANLCGTAFSDGVNANDRVRSIRVYDHRYGRDLSSAPYNLFLFRHGVVQGGGEDNPNALELAAGAAQAVMDFYGSEVDRINALRCDGSVGATVFYLEPGNSNNHRFYETAEALAQATQFLCCQRQGMFCGTPAENLMHAYSMANPSAPTDSEVAALWRDFVNAGFKGPAIGVFSGEVLERLRTFPGLPSLLGPTVTAAENNYCAAHVGSVKKNFWYYNFFRFDDGGTYAQALLINPPPPTNSGSSSAPLCGSGG